MPLLKPFTVFLFLALSPCLLNANDPETLSFESRNCGVSFQFPKEWLAEEIALERPLPKKKVCAIRVKPKDLERRQKEDRNIDFYSIYIDVDALDYESAMNRLFDRGENGWVVSTGLAEAPAYEISSPDWIGVRGVGGSRYFSEDGEHAGYNDIFLAALNNRSRLSAIITGLAQSENAFNLIIKSLKFIDTPPSKESH